MNLKYLPSLLFINITGGKKLFVGGTDLRRRRGGGGGGGRKGEAMLSGVKKKIMIRFDCFELTVLTVDFYYSFFPLQLQNHDR